MSLRKSSSKPNNGIISSQILDEQLETCVWLPVLVWAFRFYGVELCHQKISRIVNLAYYFLTTCMIFIQIATLLILVYLITLLRTNSVESMFMYNAVPVVSLGISSLICYIIFLRKRPKIRTFLVTIFFKLRTTFRKSPLSIRNEIKRNESFVVIGFFMLFVVQMVQRIASSLMRQPIKPMTNLTLFNMEIDFEKIKPYSWLIQCVALDIHLFDILTISLLIIICQLLLVCFRYIESHLTDLNELDTLENGNMSRSQFQKFYRLHREACVLVTEAQDIFAPFILLWCATQVLNTCFWIRSMKFAYMRTLQSTTIVILHLICSGIPFSCVTTYAIRVNEQVSRTLLAVTRQILSENEERRSKCYIYHTLYVSNYIMTPVCFNGCGFFTLNKGFVLTILGTVLTYTLVLYGLD
ncbi:hypothetical protein CHUAL_003183 [Chamberlinius hualienensis]